MTDLARALETRATELNLTQTDVAKMIGMAPASVSLLFNGYTSKPRRWREIAKALQIDEQTMMNLMRNAGIASLEAARSARRQRNGGEDDAITSLAKISQPSATTAPEPQHQVPSKSARMIPILGEAVPGHEGHYVFDGSVIDYTACPPALSDVPGAYATFVGGDLMFPRYKSGEIVWIHPHRPARSGDDVIVQIRAKRGDRPTTGLLKEFVGWDKGELVLRQYSDQGCTSIERAAVSSVHVVVGAARY